MLGELALRLARELGECQFFSPWAQAFPKPDRQLIGSGLEEFGVTRVDFPLELVGVRGEPDIYIFPDLYFADMQTMLRRLDLQVWGSGWGELLELDRPKLYDLLERNGFLVPPVETVTGVQALEQRLRRVDERFVKLPGYYRGIAETYDHRGWPASRTWFEKLRADLGSRGETMSFMLQEPVPGDHVVEPGVDLIVINGEIQYPLLVGWERKEVGLIAQVVEDIPALLRPSVETVVEALSAEGAPYNNFFSAELRVNEHREVYFLDATCRMPMPADAVHYELCENLGAVMTRGESPEYGARYACQLILTSPFADKRPLHVAFPEELRDNVKLYWFYRDPKGDYWTLPNEVHNVASVVATGNVLEEVKRRTLELAKEVKFDGATYEGDCFERIEEDIERGTKNGVPFE
jgi:hypothetical protein